MQLKQIEAVYQNLTQSIEILQNKLSLSYFDALIETLENLLEQTINASDELDDSTVNELKKIYRQIDVHDFESEDWRQVVQLLLLGSYKKQAVQPNHQMTPDSIGFLLTFLMQKLIKKSNLHTLLDLGVGTGNLLSVIINNLKKAGYQLNAYGVDNDDTLLSIADVSTALQKNENVELLHQDAIDEIMVPKVDVVVSDLPIGYYPIDERVQNFKSKVEKGHSFAHYLLIERGINQLADAGWGFFIIPSGLFENEDAQKLLKTIQNKAFLQGILNLPQDLFVNEKSRKAIMMVQHKGQQAHQAQQILLGDFPSMKNQAEFSKFLNEIDLWVKQNIK
ncbi:MAG TPA: class I SAM-dependent methyltransferase [Candidatus Ligilactobacillus excrementigallinarum]|uniref:Class I SAM-dependent methyltransferase n=1 Tax=Candidatus Ligilactobacillus excrementigallinarum TaxID=2838641 RepID=A0A9D1UX47_9LACO|nr:class I SAM-dependent methyltransferase [Candidatus Ligilactobacillus excrementigallinarum]